MALKLNTRELPAVTFTRKLPAAFGPSGVDGYKGAPVECYITVEAKAGGDVNPDYVLAMERVRLAREIAARRLGRVTDDEVFVVTDRDNRIDSGVLLFGALYDACIIRWETNVCSDGKPIDATRENFMGMVVAKTPSIEAAMLDMRKAIIDAGNELTEVDAALIKN